MEFIDLKAQYQALKAKIDRRIHAVLEHGRFIMGPEVEELERQLAEFTGRKYCLSCANGTDALQMAFMACGIQAGDAVFCPDVTFIASIEPACMLGASAVFCDIDARTYNICPQSLERQIKAVRAEGRLNPKAVVAVDLLGNPAEYSILSEICARYGLILIEDAAQGFGASYHGEKCGAFGKIAITSFFPAKPLGCYGDGGAIFTEDGALAVLLDSLRVHGKGRGGKYDNDRIGVNSRLDTIQAAILLEKLSAFREYEIDARQKIAARYNEAFKDKLVTPFVASGCESSWAQYALLAHDQGQRDKIVDCLNAGEIPNMIYYPKPMHLLPVFTGVNHYGEEFENARSYCARTFSLPMHPYLGEAEQDKVIASVLGAVHAKH